MKQKEKSIKNKLLESTAKLTNISLTSLSAYAAVYYSNSEILKKQIDLPILNEFLDTMKDKFINSPEEVFAAGLTVAGSYMMGHKNPHVRFLTFSAWTIGNILYAHIALKNNMAPLLGQMVVFQMINFYAMKNILKDEIVPSYKKSLSEDKVAETTKEKLLKFKNNAVVNSANRISKINNSIKDSINNIIQVVKENKNKSLLLLSSAVATTFIGLEKYTNLNSKLPELMSSLGNVITNSPLETTAALTALIGSYMLSKTGIDTKIKGVSLFLAADVMYMDIAYSHDMAPMLVQTMILVGGSLKALDNLYATKDQLSISEFKKNENSIFKNIEDKFNEFKANINLTNKELEIEKQTCSDISKI